MAEENQVYISEVGTFLPGIPQDVIDRNISDPVLKVLMCQGIVFTKSDVLNVAKQVGIKMRSTVQWLDARMKDGSVVQSPCSDPLELMIDARWWLEFMRLMPVKDMEYIYRRDYGLRWTRNKGLSALSMAANTCLHGVAFVEYIALMEKECPVISEAMPMSAYLCCLSAYECMHPMLCAMRKRTLDVVFADLTYKLGKFRISHEEFSALEKLVSAKEDYVRATFYEQRAVAAMSYYYDFLKCGDIKAAKKRIWPFLYLYNVYDALSAMQAGDYNGAVRLFNKALKDTGGKFFWEKGLNYYYGLALSYSTLVTSKNKLKKLANDYDVKEYADETFKIILSLGKRETVDGKEALQIAALDDTCQTMFTLLTLKHFQQMEGVEEGFVNSILDKGDALDLKVLQIDLATVFDRYKDNAEELMKETGLHTFLKPYEVKPLWENVIDDLMILNGISATGKAKAAKPKVEPTARIVYEVNLQNLSVQPILQKSKNGITWTAGRNIALKRFAVGNVEGYTPADAKVAACVQEETYGWYDTVYYDLCGSKALAALAGHPHVYEAGTGVHLDVVEEQLQIGVKSREIGFAISASVNVTSAVDGYVIDKSQKPLIKIVKVDTKITDTLKALFGVKLPLEAKDKLTRLMEGLSSKVVVMGDLIKESDHLKEVPAHSEMVVQLRPDGELIKCQVCVRPFGDVPPMCKPGKGMAAMTASIKKEMVRTTRDLQKEKQNYKRLLELLSDYDGDGSESWDLDAEECLQVLERLRDMSDCCIVEWPEGERFRVSYAAVQPSGMSVSVHSLSSWFEMSGEVRVADDVRLKMSELMERLKESVGNFIRVKDDDYVRISDDLRRYLDSINRVASVSRGKVKVSSFNAVQLDGMEEAGVQFDADEAFTSLIRSIGESQEVKCRIPKNIQADLRSYQKEGYEWMTRLAHWGAGALLADDMGLGKTLQTITLLLSRASQGAQLVVVPTSLILNWQSEIERFAPSLSVTILNRAGSDREKMLNDAKAFDVVITTYGLLVTEEERLTSRLWTTVVLDEAHAIKNKETKMSKAAMELKADFRVLLTGTPLQNHVSEMWNLMQFANPGLLGTFQQFSDRFLLPIERDHDKETQKVLRRIISPFILRRTKTDVLSELPEKTEITIKVDLSDEEMAFYENIREEALTNLTDASSTAMQALAEITRLRQAACNTRLVNAKVKLPSSKLESFMAMVQNLHDNHHRALVFSQFTSHLALVRERLDAEGVEYLYLDGATSAKERIRLVEEFQHGEMPLFLISLKAGGLGLNLTAADYVIHLDPWWNPAIEEQASDRAYRIGQKKPVTVYRLIAAGTIEEKIIDLHAVKRNMADALLEGGDVSASMSRDEMIQLLKENSVM